jgi:hypothetical protein
MLCNLQFFTGFDNLNHETYKYTRVVLFYNLERKHQGINVVLRERFEKLIP